MGEEVSPRHCWRIKAQERRGATGRGRDGGDGGLGKIQIARLAAAFIQIFVAVVSSRRSGRAAAVWDSSPWVLLFLLCLPDITCWRARLRSQKIRLPSHQRTWRQ